MQSLINLRFLIPAEIAKGLDAGTLERIGGVIRETNSKQVVLWLREGTQVTGGKWLVVKGTTLLKAGLAGLDAFYMESRFRELRAHLIRIEQKIDAQILSTLETGYQLAADAEQIADAHAQQAQIVTARAKLLEGSLIFQNLLDENSWTKQAKRKSEINTIRMAVLGKVAVARTYMLTGDRMLAAVHLEAARGMTSSAAYSICKRAFSADLFGWDWIWVPAFLLFALPAMAIGHMLGYRPFDDTDLNKVARLIWKLEEERMLTEHKLDEVLSAVKAKKLAIPKEVTELLTMQDFIRGYQIETECVSSTNSLPLEAEGN